MEEQQFKPIEETTEEPNINLPVLKGNKPTKEEIITDLPEWNIEPPIEINRGQNEIRWVANTIKKTRKNI